MLAHLAIVFLLAGIGDWALAFYLGPSSGYLDLQARHRFRIIVGAICFGVAGILALSIPQ